MINPSIHKQIGKGKGGGGGGGSFLYTFPS
jgi:hypothetical protein